MYLHGLAQNTSNVSGSFDIGPIGNATYNIPIDLPPGTAGLQPNISIVYNSFSGDGIMGKGFEEDLRQAKADLRLLVLVRLFFTTALLMI